MIAKLELLETEPLCRFTLTGTNADGEEIDEVIEFDAYDHMDVFDLDAVLEVADGLAIELAGQDVLVMHGTSILFP